MTYPRAPMHGFTIIELIVTMTIAGMLMMFAVPAFNTFIQNQRLTTITNSLVLSLNFARSEAIKRDAAAGVTICASTDQQACNGANWAQGWMVVDVVANSGSLQGMPAIAATNTVSEANGQLQVVFRSNGTATNAASFTVCDSRGATYAHSVDVGPTGRVLSSPTPGMTVYNAALACP